MDLWEIAFSGKEEIFTKIPLALFWTVQFGDNAKLLDTLTFKKKAPLTGGGWEQGKYLCLRSGS